jgi:hypothetical protein
MDKARNNIAITAANLYLCARFEHQKAFTIGMRLHLSHLIQIDDGGPMHALECARIKPLFQILHCLTQD